MHEVQRQDQLIYFKVSYAGFSSAPFAECPL